MNNILKELMNPENWVPQYSEIARKTGKSVSSVHGLCQRRIKKGQFKVAITDVPETERD